mmetsp:Transcript_63608/g.71971  ORF Transcript_63608/g.71971 Transcript_63608/m.71971 type:complete len:92 (+) Transcript_63608:434-709(+)
MIQTPNNKNNSHNYQWLQLFRRLFISSTTGTAFSVCLIDVYRLDVQAIMDTLVFLCFENVGSSDVLLGCTCTVVAKIAFEITTVFYDGDYL